MRRKLEKNTDTNSPAASWGHGGRSSCHTRCRINSLRAQPTPSTPATCWQAHPAWMTFRYGQSTASSYHPRESVTPDAHGNFALILSGITTSITRPQRGTPYVPRFTVATAESDTARGVESRRYYQALGIGEQGAKRVDQFSLARSVHQSNTADL